MRTAHHKRTAGVAVLKCVMDIERIKEILLRWVQSKASIKSIHIYGSRATNDFRAGSDLDIAIEIYNKKEEADVIWIDNKKKWQAELTNLINYKIHLELLSDSIPKKGVQKSGILVYSKVF